MTPPKPCQQCRWWEWDQKEVHPPEARNGYCHGGLPVFDHRRPIVSASDFCRFWRRAK